MSSLFAAMLLSMAPAPAVPAPVSPNFMPGFPLLAGDVVMIMWAPVPGAVGYNVYMNGTVVGKSLPAPPFQMDAPQNAGEYNFEISSLGADGSESPKTAGKAIKIIKIMPPQDLSVLVGEKNIALRWLPAPGTIITDIYRSEKSGGGYTLLTSVQDTRYSDSNVVEGKEYFYRLKAKDVSGKESGFSQEVAAKIQVAAVQVDSKVVLNLVPTRIEGFLPSPTFSYGDLILSEKEIYLLDRGDALIKVYDFEGKEVGRIGRRGYLEGELQYPVGMARLPSGGFIVTDNNRKKVIHLTETGNFVREWALPPVKDGKLARPGAVAVNHQGEIFVADFENLFIHVYSVDGKLLDTFGGKSTRENRGPEFYQGIGSMVFGRDGSLYVSDFRAALVRVVSPDRKSVRTIGASKGIGSLVQPGKVELLEEKGVVLVPDELMASIQAFDLKTGEYRYTWTNEKGEADPTKEMGVTMIRNPKGVWALPGGQFLSVNSLNSSFYRISVLQ